MNFIKGLSITSGTTVLITIIAFLNNVIVTRQIGADGRGKYVVISNIILMFALLFGEGIIRSNTLLVGNSKSNLSKLISQTLVYGILLFIVFLIIFFLKAYWLFLIPNLSNHLIIFALIITLFTILWRAIQALFLGVEKIYEFSFLQILTIGLTFLINLIGILLLNFGLSQIIYTMAFSTIVTLFFGIFMLKAKINLIDFDYSVLKISTISISAKSTLSALQNFATLKGDIFLINFIISSASAGIYSVALVFTEILQKIPNIAGALLFSRSANNIHKNTEEIAGRLFKITLYIDIIISILLIFIGKELIVWLFGNEFKESYFVLLLLLPALVFYGPGSILHAYFMGKGYPKFMLWCNGIIAALNISFNIVLIPIYGIKVAGIISSLSYTLWTLFYMTYFIKNTSQGFKSLFLVNIEDIRAIQKIFIIKNSL